LGIRLVSLAEIDWMTDRRQTEAGKLLLLSPEEAKNLSGEMSSA
jgi:hypothetical protein